MCFLYLHFQCSTSEFDLSSPIQLGTALCTPAQETFIAEVEVLREEMQSTEVVIEGEFLSHVDMTDKGMSEYFGAY